MPRSERTADDLTPERYAGVILKLMSTAGGEWVSAPMEMKSTPVSA